MPDSSNGSALVPATLVSGDDQEGQPTWEALLAPLHNFRAPLGMGKMVDLSPLHAATSVWLSEVRTLDRRDASITHLAFAEASDPSLVASMASFSPPALHPGFYLSPVLGAWAFLGLTEYRYQQAFQDRRAKPAFFAWWTGQPLGPWVFSAIIAMLVLVIVLAEARVRRRQRRLRMLQADFDVLCIALSTRVASALRAAAKSSEPGSVLTGAGRQLEQAAKNLEKIRTQLVDESAPGGTAIEAALELRGLFDYLGERIESLVIATRGLERVVDAIPERVAGWSADLSGFADISATLKVHAEQTSAASRQFSESTTALTSTFPNLAYSIDESHRLSALLAESERTIGALVEQLNASLLRAKSDTDNQLENLETTVTALTQATNQLRTASDRLNDGIIIADALQTLPPGRNDTI